MDSYFKEADLFDVFKSGRSSESDDSQRLVIAEEYEDSGGSESNESLQDNTEKRYTYEEYKKICVRNFILKKLTYFKLKRLMALYQTELSEKIISCRRKSLASWKTAKTMSKTLMMFHLMFEETKENITLDSIYYQRMSDLISIYIDFEIKASEVSVESACILSSRITSLMEKCLDHQHRFTLDTILKSHNICNKFQEISTLLISRVVRGLPSTKHSEQFFLRSMLVFKLWIQITKDVNERTKILKLASHLAKPPVELMKDPSKLAKDILPCNFHKCYIDLATYIIGTPWPLRKKIKTFLEHTRIVETHIPKESFSKSSEISEAHKNEEMADIKAFKEIQFGLQEIILSEKKSKQIIKTLKNSHYKYAPFEELSEMDPLSYEYTKISKKDVSTQTLAEQDEEFSFSHSKVIHECINELFKRIVEHTNVEQIQNQDSEERNLQHGKILAELSITDMPNNIRNANFLQESIPKEVTDLLNFDSSPTDKKKTIMPIIDSHGNIKKNDVAVLKDIRKNKKHMENEMVSTISVRPAATISNNLDNVSTKAMADWHTPEVHCQSNVSSYNPLLPSYRMPMASGLINKGPTEINQHVPELPSMTSALTSQQEIPTGLNNEQLNPYANLVRATDSLISPNSSLSLAPTPPHSELNLTNGSPTTLLNRRAVLKSSFISDSFPGCREDEILVKDTSIKYYPPLSKNNSNPTSFNQVQGMTSAGGMRDCNHPIQQPHPMTFNQYSCRPHYPPVNNPFRFYDDDTIANSSTRIMGRQRECSVDPHSLMRNTVQLQHPLPFNLPSGNNDEPMSYTNQAKRKGRGNGNTSSTQRTNRKQPPGVPANIVLNTNLSYDNPALQRWHNIPTQQYSNSFRTLDSSCIPNSSSQSISRSLAPSPIFRNDSQPPSSKLPSYDTIRKKNNGLDTALPITESPSISLPINTIGNYFPDPNVPIAVPIASSQSFSPIINNSLNLPAINIPSSLTATNVSVSGPVISASTSFSVPTSPETNSEIMKSNNFYRRYPNDFRFTKFQLFQNSLNFAFRKAIILLTCKNDLGFLEYNFKKMPIPLQAFEDGLYFFEKSKSNIDNIVTLLSQTNGNFMNERNMFPPQLLKVNNIDIYKGKVNMGQEQRKLHEITLHNDYSSFVYQDKIRNLYSRFSSLSHNDFMVKSDQKIRCNCLQCLVNTIVLVVNRTILDHFRHYQKYIASKDPKENEKNQASKMAETSKRSLEMSIEEEESPLPLKKRLTSTSPNEVRSVKDIEVSYPSTPMISIAELELLKNMPTNIENITESVSGIPNSRIPNYIAEPQLSEINKNISTNKPVPEVTTCHVLENNESRIISTNNNNLSHVSSSPVVECTVAEQPRKSQEKNVSKKSLRRTRQYEKKNGRK
ncbi:unnamed protein product [Nezara viridula]|uniref:Uncharacterized protein n=1 Tax=Nezara viridula TaxID=85310 RepID=A0A9P0E117_NEZVI|nr:unnamed protein product [Nezara viridula]